MIKKLKIRFIVLAMSSLVLLLAVIVAGMNVINYNSVVAEADRTLMFLSQNKGTFPKFEDDKMGLPPHMSPETPYESRYFSVLLNTSGGIIQTETSKIAAVDISEAMEYAKEAIESSDEKGFADNFRYNKSNEGENIRITFLDCGRTLDSFFAFLWTSTGIALVGLLITFLVVFFFAGRIIRPVAESYEKQKRFITDAGHEIKTPLTIINANVDLLEMDMDENECLADIRQQTQRLTSLTNDLVYLARMEEASHSLCKVELPISDVIFEAASPFKAIAQSRGTELICNIQPMLSMEGDHKSICQLISVLMDNALKYSPEGGTVSLNFVKHGKLLQLDISNTVANDIGNDSLTHLFDRFYRVDTSRNSETGGHGIGLSVAKAIVVAHGGKITAWSRERRIFNITVTFPA